MEAHSRRTHWTYAEFARLPSEGAERHEIIGGALHVTPAPRVDHQRVVSRLDRVLGAFVEDHEVGEVFVGPIDVLLAEGDYLQPDLVFVRRGREALLTDRGIEGPPDLVIEVVSPSTEARDRGVKIERYRHYGVGAYWIVDPDARTVDVWKFEADADAPVVLASGERLHWTPVPGAPTLEMLVEDAFRGVEQGDRGLPAR